MISLGLEGLRQGVRGGWTQSLSKPFIAALVAVEGLPHGIVGGVAW